MFCLLTHREAQNVCAESPIFIITKTLATGNTIITPTVLKQWHPLVGFEHKQHTNQATKLIQFFTLIEIIWFPCRKCDEFRITFCSEDELSKLTSTKPNVTLGFSLTGRTGESYALNPLIIFLIMHSYLDTQYRTGSVPLPGSNLWP